MEERRFDDLTRVLGKATSRRGVLKGLLGGAVAALVGTSAAPAAARGTVSASTSVGGCSVSQCMAEADQSFRQEEQACGASGSSPGSGLCVLSALYQRYVNQKHCRKTGCFLGTCSNGVCCTIGTVGCDGNCVDVETDPRNCGTCGHACDEGVECSGGQCQCADPQQTSCAGNCVNPQNDPDNCGSCGHACTGCETCLEGECVSKCTDDAPCCNGQCVSTQCSDPQVFNPVTCQCECPGGNTPCGDQCVDIYSDDQHCGSCGKECSNCEECVHGVCQPLNCGDGSICCDGHCVALCEGGAAPDPVTCQCTTCESGEPCGPFCCSEDKVCCPDTLSGMSCRDPNGDCGCGVTCGDMCCGQYEFCCRAADYSYHCVASSGDTC